LAHLSVSARSHTIDVHRYYVDGINMWTYVSVLDDGYFRNVSCALHSIFTIVLNHINQLHWHICLYLPEVIK